MKLRDHGSASSIAAWISETEILYVGVVQSSSSERWMVNDWEGGRGKVESHLFYYKGEDW